MVALIFASAIACFDEPTGPALDIEPALAVAFSAPDTTVLTPTVDGWIDTNKKNKAHGTNATLEIGGADSARVLLHFDKTAIINAVGSDQLLSATLEIGLETNGGGWPGGEGRLDLFDMSAEPTESGSTWNCAFDDAPQNNKLDCDPPFVWDMSGSPPFAWPPIGDDIIFDFTDRPISFDVTDGVQEILDTGLYLGWLIKKSHEAQGGFLEIGAREGSSGPSLNLVLSSDTILPPIPGIPPPEDSLYLVSDASGAFTYYRRLAAVRFPSTISGAAFNAFLQRWGGQLVGGEFDYYYIQFPDPGATWASFQAHMAGIAADPDVWSAFELARQAPHIVHGSFPSDGAFARPDWFVGSATTRAFRAIRAPQAWQCENGTYGGPLVDIGVLEWDFGPSSDLLQQTTTWVLPR